MTADTTGPTLMRAPTSAGAASRDVRDWSQVNWRQVDRNVRRLQVHIVKATKEGRWNKVQALQRLLTHSFSGKALAVRRVTTNRGKRTPGVDGTIWSTPASRVDRTPFVGPPYMYQLDQFPGVRSPTPTSVPTPTSQPTPPTTPTAHPTPR
jgi:hypothetical protein